MEKNDNLKKNPFYCLGLYLIENKGPIQIKKKQTSKKKLEKKKK